MLAAASPCRNASLIPQGKALAIKQKSGVRRSSIRHISRQSACAGSVTIYAADTRLLTDCYSHAKKRDRSLIVWRTARLRQCASCGQHDASITRLADCLHVRSRPPKEDSPPNELQKQYSKSRLESRKAFNNKHKGLGSRPLAVSLLTSILNDKRIIDSDLSKLVRAHHLNWMTSLLFSE